MKYREQAEQSEPDVKVVGKRPSWWARRSRAEQHVIQSVGGLFVSLYATIGSYYATKIGVEPLAVAVSATLGLGAVVGFLTSFGRLMTAGE